MEIKDEKFVTAVQAKKILKGKEKVKELGYEQKNALEFLNKFSKIKLKDAEEMFNELNQIQKLKEKHIVNIIDILPKDMEDLRVIFSNEIISLSEEEKKKILDIVKKHTT